MKIEIINDFVGLSQGLVTLKADDLKVIHKVGMCCSSSCKLNDSIILEQGEDIEKGVKACIGAGTGLGEAYLT